MRNGHLIGYCLTPDELPALGVDMSQMAIVGVGVGDGDGEVGDGDGEVGAGDGEVGVGDGGEGKLEAVCVGRGWLETGDDPTGDSAGDGTFVPTGRTAGGLCAAE